GFDFEGKNEPAPGHIRLSPASKSVLLDVTVQDKLNAALRKEFLPAVLNEVAKAYCQGNYGPGVHLYYKFNSRTMADWKFTWRGTAKFLAQLKRSVQPRREREAGVPIRQFWHHLAVADTVKVENFPGFPQAGLRDAELSGFSNSADS